MTRLTKLSRIAVNLLQSLSKRKGEITDQRINSCCRKLRECLPALLQELSEDKIVGGSLGIYTYVSLCLMEGLVEHLVPFLVQLQSWGITSAGVSPSEKLRLQTWDDGMSVLIRLTSLAHEICTEYPQPSRLLVKSFLPSNDEPPGGASSSTWRHAPAPQLLHIC